jgi:hypothetical protein
MSQTIDIPLLAYPTLTEVARLLGVSASTLSRRGDLVCERMGKRDKRITATEVMRLAALYRKRSLGEVATGLVHHAHEHAPQHEGHVREEIERFFEQREPAVVSPDQFLAEAERALPVELYEQVRRVYRASETEPVPPPALVSAGE